MKQDMINKVTGGLLTCALLLGAGQLDAQIGSRNVGSWGSGTFFAEAGECDCPEAPAPEACEMPAEAPPPVGPPPCPTGCTCLGRVYVAGQALYWRRGDCSARYAIEGGTDLALDFTAGTYEKLNEQYIKHTPQWGFRVMAGVDKGWVTAAASYLRFEGKGASSVDRRPGPTEPPGPHQFLFPPGGIGNWARMRADQNITYQNGTVQFGFPVNGGGGGQVAFRYVDIEQNTHVQAFLPTVGGVVAPNSVGSGFARSGFRGGGVGVGFHSENAAPFAGFSFGFDALGWGLVGESTTATSEFRIIPLADQATPGQDLILRHRKQNYWVGAVELRVVLSYVYECGCAKIRVRGGWEIQTYYNALFDQPDEGLTPRGETLGEQQAPNLLRETAYRVLSFGGPTVSLGVTF